MLGENDSGKHYLNGLKMYIDNRCFEFDKREMLYEKGLDILFDEYNLLLKKGTVKSTAKLKAFFFSMDQTKKFFNLSLENLKKTL